MKMTEADVLWVPTRNEDPDAGDICVRRHGTHHRSEYPNHSWMPVTGIGPFSFRSAKGDRVKQALLMFVLFNTVTVRDGIDAQKAHKAFLEIDEYRKTISPDESGAED